MAAVAAKSLAFDSQSDKASTRFTLREAANGSYQVAYLVPSKHWKVSFSQTGDCKPVFGYFAITNVKDGDLLTPNLLNSAWSQTKTLRHRTLYFGNSGQTTVCKPPQMAYQDVAPSAGFGVSDIMEVKIDDDKLTVLKNGQPYHTVANVAGESLGGTEWRPSICFHKNAPAGATAVVEFITPKATPASPKPEPTSTSASKLRRAFEAFDEDKSGTIDHEEWLKAMEGHGMPQEDAEEIFDDFKNDAGVMVYADFCTAFAEVFGEGEEDESVSGGSDGKGVVEEEKQAAVKQVASQVTKSSEDQQKKPPAAGQGASQYDVCMSTLDLTQLSADEASLSALNAKLSQHNVHGKLTSSSFTLGAEIWSLAYNGPKQEHQPLGDHAAIIRSGRMGGATYAFGVKIIDKHLCANVDDVTREIEAHHLQMADGRPLCPYLTRMYGNFDELSTVNGHKELLTYIVSDAPSGGQLFDRVYEKGRLPPSEALPLLIQLLEACKYLHAKEYVHGGIDPFSIVYVRSTQPSPIMLVDWSCSRPFGEYKHLSRVPGNPAYAAPETLTQKKYFGPADIWSVGCIFYMMLSGSPPFEQERHADEFAEDASGIQAMFMQIIKGDYHFPSPLWDKDKPAAAFKEHINALMTVDAAKRVTAAKMLDDFKRAPA